MYIYIYLHMFFPSFPNVKHRCAVSVHTLCIQPPCALFHVPLLFSLIHASNCVWYPQSLRSLPSVHFCCLTLIRSQMFQKVPMGTAFSEFWHLCVPCPWRSVLLDSQSLAHIFFPDCLQMCDFHFFVWREVLPPE